MASSDLPARDVAAPGSAAPSARTVAITPASGLTRTFSAPLLGDRPFEGAYAGEIAGPDTEGNFRREFVQRQRKLQQQQQAAAKAAAAAAQKVQQSAKAPVTAVNASGKEAVMLGRSRSSSIGSMEESPGTESLYDSRGSSPIREIQAGLPQASDALAEGGGCCAGTPSAAAASCGASNGAAADACAVGRPVTASALLSAEAAQAAAASHLPLSSEPPSVAGRFGSSSASSSVQSNLSLCGADGAAAGTTGGGGGAGAGPAGAGCYAGMAGGGSSLHSASLTSGGSVASSSQPLSRQSLSRQSTAGSLTLEAQLGSQPAGGIAAVGTGGAAGVVAGCTSPIPLSRQSTASEKSAANEGGAREKVGDSSLRLEHAIAPRPSPHT